MAFTLPYQPPGVSVSEDFTPSVNPLLATPANVCVIGKGQGFITKTDRITVTGTEEVSLPRLPAGATLLPGPIVKNDASPDPDPSYTENIDYQVIYANTPVDEAQTITVGGTGLGGTYTLNFNGETTVGIAPNASSTTVKTALTGLATVDDNDITVSGSAGGPYSVTFVGQYAGVNVSLLTADITSMTGTGKTVTVAETTQGRSGAAIKRVGSGIDTGATLAVTYQYTPLDYYVPTRLDEQSSVEQKYGPAYNDDGTIGSEISFAASVAFENGARDIVIQPLFVLTDANDPNSERLRPTPTQVTSATICWGPTLVALRDIEDINIIVPAVGQSFVGDNLSDAEMLEILKKVQAHIRYMKDQQQYIVGIFGEDSSLRSTDATKSTLRNHVLTLQSAYDGVVNEQIVFVAPSKFTRVNPVSGANFYVGGQYVAAGIAGLLAGQPVSSAITRKVVSGFTEVADPRSKADKNADAQAGLVVVEQQGGVVRIRHGITIDTSATARREISVVRAKHRMIESVRDTIDTQIIGKVIADGESPLVVASAVAGVLEQLKKVKDLVGYRDVQARISTLDPTTVEVRFSYKPAFPLNYVNIVFSLDLTAGEVVTVSTI